MAPEAKLENKGKGKAEETKKDQADVSEENSYSEHMKDAFGLSQE